MKLNYQTIPPSEGGGAIPGVGTIHKSEIAATLTKLSDDLEWPIDFRETMVGSGGKSEYSGDLDIVIEDEWWGSSPSDIIDFYKMLLEVYSAENVSKNGIMVHLKYPIVGYDESYDERLPRTGFVQIDFMFGNFIWEHFYHYSPGEQSGYKGAHRNLAISAICAANAEIVNRVVDSFGRPLTIVKYKWGQNGLIKVQRDSVMRNNKWIRKQQDTILAKPILFADHVAEIIFPKDGTPDDLSSLERIIDAVKRNYPVKTQDRIFKQMAENFLAWPDGIYFNYPAEISLYFSQDDK